MKPGYSRLSLRPIVGTKSDATYWGQRIAPLQRKRIVCAVRGIEGLRVA